MFSEPLSIFTVKIDTNNAAFSGDPAPELSRILRAIADRVEGGEDISMFQTILDANGADVGFAHKPASYYH